MKLMLDAIGVPFGRRAQGPLSGASRVPGVLIGLFLGAVVFASRYQAIAFNSELNPDESQLLAQVMRLGIDPVPWRGVDGTRAAR